MRTFLIGTDWWTDCDDAAAIRLAARAALEKKIRIAGIGLNACMEHSAASLTAFLEAEGLPGIPLGIDLAATDFGGRPPYQARLAAGLARPLKNEDLPDAAALYHSILRQAKEAGEQLEIVEIGYPQVLAAVLAADPALFTETVSAVWMMAGKWDDNPGRENNFARNARASAGAAYFVEHCPVPITFLGWEVGASVIAGGRLAESDPLHQVFADHGSAKGRSAWDPMLMTLAILGSPEEAGYSTVTGYASADPVTGYNTFREAPAGLHRYVVKAMPDEWYRDRLDEALASR